jgi:mgtE-like transporter
MRFWRREERAIEEEIGEVEIVVEEEVSITRKVLRQALPILIFYSFVELLAGMELNWALGTITLLPGAIILVPAVMDMRGNIIGALGARLGSAAHLGLLKPPHRDQVMNQNMIGAVGTSFVIAIIAGISAYYVTLFLGIPSASLLKFVIAAMMAGVLSGLSLTAIAIVVTIMTSWTHLDPDNIIQPITAALGDILSVLWVLLAVKFVLVI